MYIGVGALLSRVVRIGQRLVLHTAVGIHTLWIWAFARADITASHAFTLDQSSKVLLSYRWPFIRRVVLHYDKWPSRAVRPRSREPVDVIRAYPVNGSGMYREHGQFTKIHSRLLAPPKSRVATWRILSAALHDESTGTEVDVTEEMRRLAGPLGDFFGFSYPMSVISPWLCERTGLVASLGDLTLSLCMDETYHVYKIRGNQLAIIK